MAPPFLENFYMIKEFFDNTTGEYKWSFERTPKKNQDKKCLFCGNTVLDRKRKYCSDACQEQRYNSRHTWFTKKCPVCSSDFETINRRQICCGVYCQKKRLGKIVQKEWENPNDNLIQGILSRQGIENASEALINLKREQLKLKRTINEKQRRINNS